jgi:hypothetical protein
LISVVFLEPFAERVTGVRHDHSILSKAGTPDQQFA